MPRKHEKEVVPTRRTCREELAAHDLERLATKLVLAYRTFELACTSAISLEPLRTAHETLEDHVGRLGHENVQALVAPAKRGSGARQAGIRNARSTARKKLLKERRKVVFGRRGVPVAIVAAERALENALFALFHN